MTEKNLFSSTMATLGLTIMAPLFVGLSGIGAPANTSANDLVKSYVAANQQSTTSGNDNKAGNNDNNNANQNGQSSGDNTNNNDNTTNAGNSSSGSQPSSTGAAASAGSKSAGTYVVKDGDTYGCIAEKYYGSYDQWPKLYAANAMYPGYEEYHLNVGATMQMPAVDAEHALPKTNLCQ